VSLVSPYIVFNETGLGSQFPSQAFPTRDRHTHGEHGTIDHDPGPRFVSWLLSAVLVRHVCRLLARQNATEVLTRCNGLAALFPCRRVLVIPLGPDVRPMLRQFALRVQLSFAANVDECRASTGLTYSEPIISWQRARSWHIQSHPP